MSRVRTLTARPRILTKELRSIEGIWIRDSKIGRVKASAYTMEHETPISHDIVLAAVTVVPFSILWVVYNNFLGGFAIALLSFAAYEYGIPILRGKKYDLQPIKERAVVVLQTLKQFSDLIRSRVVRRA